MLRRFLKLFVVCLFGCLLADSSNSSEPLSRIKRQYYDGYGYGDYYGWQIGRIVGWIIGLLLFLLFLCVPCICCIGIWFAGWFGVRSLMSRRKNSAANQSTTSRVRFVERDHPPPPNPEIEHRVVYTQATDRYFERRESSPSPPPPARSFYDRQERDTRRY